MKKSSGFCLPLRFLAYKKQNDYNCKQHVVVVVVVVISSLSCTPSTYLEKGNKRLQDCIFTERRLLYHHTHVFEGPWNAMFDQARKHPIAWWWWRDFSLSIMPWTFLNSSTWQGMVMVPFWSNPYSSSASFRSCKNSGWLKYITGTTNLCCSSPWPTLIARHPFGTSLTSCFFPWWWWWRWGRCRWKPRRLFSPLPISVKIIDQKRQRKIESSPC